MEVFVVLAVLFAAICKFLIVLTLLTTLLVVVVISIKLCVWYFKEGKHDTGAD